MIVQAQKIDNQNNITTNHQEANSSDNKPKVTFTDVPAKKTVPVSTTTTTTTKTVTTSTTTTTTTTKPEASTTNNSTPSKSAETKPAESKPAESKTVNNNKPAESKPSQTDNKSQAESKPADNKPAQTKPAESKQADNKPAKSDSKSNTEVTSLDNGTTTTGDKILATSDQTIKSLNELSSFGISKDVINLIKSCNPSNITIHEFDTAEVLAGGKAPAGYIPVEVNGTEVTYEAPTGTITFNAPKGTKIPQGVKDLGNGLYSVTFKNNTKPVKVPENISKPSDSAKVVNYDINVVIKDANGKVISKQTIKANTGKDFKLPAIKLPQGYTEVAETINGQPSKDVVYTAPSDPSKGVDIVITVKEDASAKAHQTVTNDTNKTDNKATDNKTDSKSDTTTKPANKPADNKPSSAEQGKTEQVNKDQSKDVKGDTETNNKTTDSKIVVEVLANGQTVLSTKTFSGKPGEVAHLVAPDYKGYTLTDITVNGKNVKELPTKFDNGMQLVIYHVANKSGVINVKILNQDGKEVGTQKLTGFLGTNANMSNLKLPKGYRISTIVSNGEVVDSVAYKEGTQNIIVNLEPNKESTVVVQFVGKDGKKLKNDYIVEGLTGKVLKLNDNLLPVGYKVIGITVNGKQVTSVPTVFPGENEKIVITMEKLGSTNSDTKSETTKGSVNSTSTGKTAVSHSISSDNSSQGTQEESGQTVSNSTSNTTSNTTTSNRGDFETPSDTITDGDEGILGMNKVNTSTPSIIPAGVNKATLIHTGLNTSNKDVEGAISLLEAISVGMALLLKSKR